MKQLLLLNRRTLIIFSTEKELNDFAIFKQNCTFAMSNDKRHATTGTQEEW